MLVQEASGSRVREHLLTSKCLIPALHDTNPEVLNNSSSRSRTLEVVPHLHLQYMVRRGIEFRIFVSKLSELLAIKRDLPKSTVMSSVRMKISFALIRSMLICLRGSRSIKSRTMALTILMCKEI